MYKDSSSQSRYCYPDTDVLINIPGLRDPNQLEVYESLVATQRGSHLHQNPCLGAFDLKHLKAIHHYIFQDIYPFAGQIRDEDISKGFYFAPSQYILLQAKEIFRKLREESYLVGLDLEEFSQKAAELMGDINHLHPFREGNGRTQREFIRCLALRAGYKLDWSRVSTKETLDASIRSVVDETPLADVIRRCII